METTSETDKLTGALTRQAIHEVTTQWAAADRSFALALLDLDNFAHFNDAQCQGGAPGLCQHHARRSATWGSPGRRGR